MDRGVRRLGSRVPVLGPMQIFLLGFEDFAVTGRIVTIRVIDARFLVKESEDEVLAVRASDLDEEERAELRAAAGALVGLAAGAVAAGEEGAVAGAVLGADAATSAQFVMSAEQIDALAEEMEVGDAVLLLVIENGRRPAGRAARRRTRLRPAGLPHPGRPACSGRDARAGSHRG